MKRDYLDPQLQSNSDKISIIDSLSREIGHHILSIRRVHDNRRWENALFRIRLVNWDISVPTVLRRLILD